MNGFMLNVTDWYVISPAASKGASQQSGTLCVFLRHESKEHRLSAQCNKRTFLPSLPSPFAFPSSPGWRVCPHLCWDNLHVYRDFPSFICLNGHSCGQIYPMQTGIVMIILVAQQTELTQSETPPTAITDSIITT